MGMAQGGKTDSRCIYGSKFRDENYTLKHDGRGTVSMANSGPHSNCSEFFIAAEECPSLNGKHVVFGKVLTGMETVDKILGSGHKTGGILTRCQIIACGEGKGGAPIADEKSIVLADSLEEDLQSGV